MRLRIRKVLLTALFLLPLFSQPSRLLNSSEIKLALEKLNVVGNVLYIAAHPDDENTGLMAYLSKERKYRTAYLSLTRGDGGQNLIGSEKGSEIGIIRSQELLQARSIDGGEQYFTRAVDFGYSKSAEESFEIWNRNEVLADIVWVIRKFQPDIIITRFSLNDDGGHGHHLASTILAKEAFEAAARADVFPEQLKYVKPWKTKRIFWNRWRPSQSELKDLLKVDTGIYNFALGKSYNEIAAISRTMHKSQGFGMLANRGTQYEYFKLIDGEPAAEDIFDGVDVSWNRVAGGGMIGNKINEIIKNYNISNPSESVSPLLELYSILDKSEKNVYTDIKKQEVIDLIQSCAGIWIDALASEYAAVSGEEINVKTNFISRFPKNVTLEKIVFIGVNVSKELNVQAVNNSPVVSETKITIPEDYKISQPYWLEEKATQGLFTVKDRTMIGLAENLPAVKADFTVNINGTKIVFSTPLLYKWNDRVDGELYRAMEIRPQVTANFINRVEVFGDNKPKEILVKIKNNGKSAKGTIVLKDGNDWKVTPASVDFEMNKKYEEQIIKFTVAPALKSGETTLKAEININNSKYNKSLTEITHPHIKTQVYFPESEIKAIKPGAVKLNSHIGYIMGSGDEITEALVNLGYKVTMITDEMLESADLKQFDAVITGVRAYNTRERLKFDNPRLLEFVKNGGTLLVQYNVAFGLQTEDIGPYQFKTGSDRITVENAELKILKPEHQLFNFPNKIVKEDFDKWVQERGLYFASQWNEKYESLLAGNDPGEKELTGGLLFAKYGKGVFIYSGLSFFRQIPAGVPGAYKLFINMISAGKYNGK